MKKIFIILFIYAWQANFAIANTSIAFIDMDKIISTSKPGSFILSQLSDVNLKNSTNLENEAKKLKKVKKEANKKRAKIQRKTHSNVKKTKGRTDPANSK